MDRLSTWRAEEERFAEHLNFIGFTTEAAIDPNGWKVAMSPMAPAIWFRAGPHFLCLYADYPAGHHRAAVYQDLLHEVNRLNAIHWLVRCTLVARESGVNAQLSIRLQANLPIGQPPEELGACLFAWIRESTYIERAARLRAWASEDTITGSENSVSRDAHSRDPIDDHPTQTT